MLNNMLSSQTLSIDSTFTSDSKTESIYELWDYLWR